MPVETEPQCLSKLSHNTPELPCEGWLKFFDLAWLDMTCQNWATTPAKTEPHLSKLSPVQTESQHLSKLSTTPVKTEPCQKQPQRLLKLSPVKTEPQHLLKLSHNTCQNWATTPVKTEPCQNWATTPAKTEPLYLSKKLLYVCIEYHV